MIQSSFSVYTSKRDEFPDQHTSHQYPRQGEAVPLVFSRSCCPAVSNTAPDQTVGGMFSFPGLRLEHHITLSHCKNTILLYQDFFSLPFLNFGAALRCWQGALPKYTRQDSACGSGNGAREASFSTQSSYSSCVAQPLQELKELDPCFLQRGCCCLLGITSGGRGGLLPQTRTQG